MDSQVIYEDHKKFKELEIRIILDIYITLEKMDNLLNIFIHKHREYLHLLFLMSINSVFNLTNWSLCIFINFVSVSCTILNICIQKNMYIEAESSCVVLELNI